MAALLAPLVVPFEGALRRNGSLRRPAGATGVVASSAASVARAAFSGVPRLGRHPLCHPEAVLHILDALVVLTVAPLRVPSAIAGYGPGLWPCMGYGPGLRPKITAET